MLFPVSGRGRLEYNGVLEGSLLEDMRSGWCMSEGNICEIPGEIFRIGIGIEIGV
jgi:hypothetical protein